MCLMCAHRPAIRPWVTTRHLLGLYVEHVAPDLPPIDPYQLDEAT
jgi:hypothetical protein